MIYLANILPEQVAQELKDRGVARPRVFDDVSIMFTDFKGFTSIAEQMPAEKVVSELNYCFRTFDEITLKYGI